MRRGACAAFLAGVFALAVTGACSDPQAAPEAGSDDPDATEAAPVETEDAATEDPDAFPTFEIFGATMLGLGRVRDGAPLTAAEVARHQEMARSMGAELSAAAERRDPAQDVAQANQLSAKLEPVVPVDQRMAWGLVPNLFGLLRTVWEKDTWTAEELAAARAVVDGLNELGGAPKVELRAGGRVENNAALRELGAWFRDVASQDHLVAAMMMSISDGPYVGLPVPEGTSVRVVDRVRHGDAFTLELGRAETQPPGRQWVLQLRRGSDLLWSRIVSQAPDGPVMSVSLRSELAEPLGPYGWKVAFSCSGPGGDETGLLYVKPDGSLRFYFVTW